MACWVEDRWMVTVRNDDGSTRLEKSARHGKPGMRYRTRWETADGTEHAKSFEKKGDAESFRDQVAADLRRGTYLDPDAGKVTLQAFADEWLGYQTADDVSMVNIRFRVRHITAGRLGGMRLDVLARSPSAVMAWMRGLKLAPYSVRQCFSTLSSICAAAVDDGRMQRNPCKAGSITLPQLDERKVVPLETPVVDALREAMPARYRAMVDVGAWCGMRQGEIFALSPDDIDFLRKTVAVQRQVKLIGGRPHFALPKRMKTRTVPLPDVAAVAFSEHIREVGATEVTLPWHEPGKRQHGKPVTVKLMFSTPTGLAVNRSGFNARVWKPSLGRARIPATQENGMHVLRHTYASVLLANGADIKEVARCLGHKNAGFTLAVYSHIMEGGEDRIRKILDGTVNSGRSVPSPDSLKINSVS